MALLIKNVMEDIIEKRMMPIIKQTGCCDCLKCRSDIAAYVLNNVRPKYVVTEKGELFSKTVQHDTGFDTKLMILISEGVMRIKENPRHDME